MKYEIIIKSGRLTLNVRYHGKTYTETVRFTDMVKDDNYEKKFKKGISKALGKKAYKKFVNKFLKDFEV